MCYTLIEIAISPTPSPEPVEMPVDVESVEQSEPMDVASDVTTVVDSTSSKPTVQRKLVSKTYVNDEGFMGKSVNLRSSMDH